MRVVGLDVARGSVACCVMEELPPNLKDFVGKYKPIILKDNWEDYQKLLELGDLYILEPTGADYWIWIDLLEQGEKEYRLISGIRVRSYAKIHGLLDKGDREDAAVITHFGLTNLHQPEAFLEINQSELKQYWNTLKTMPKLSTSLQNRLRARLAFEKPHLAKVEIADRPWEEERASGLWRELAGIPVAQKGRRRQEPEHQLGRGISWVTEEIARLLCAHETLQGKIEQAISATMEADQSKSMRCFQEIFTDWKISDRAATGILAACHPIEQFLSQDGKRMRTRKWNSQGTQRNGQDRSLKSFQRAMAFGQIKVQSGDRMVQVSTGDPYLQTLLKNFLQQRCVIARQPQTARLFKTFGQPEDWDKWKVKQRKEWVKAHSFREIHSNYGLTPWENPDAIASVMAYNGASEQFAILQLFYEFAPQCQNLKKWKRIGKVYSKFVRMLFKDLVQKYQELN